MKRLPWILGAAGAVLVNAGCPAPGDGGDQTPPAKLLEISAQSANLAANANIHTHLTELAAVLKAFEGSEFVGQLFPSGSSGSGGEQPRPPCEPGVPCETEEETALDVSDEAADLETWLKDHIFTEANVETTTATSVTYKLKPETACEERTDENGTVARDPDCVKTVTELAFRYTATSTANGDLDLSIDIESKSGSKAHPADLELKASRVTLASDLAEVKKAVDLIAGVQGETIEDFPSTFQGKFKLAATRDSDKVYTFGLSVLDAIRIGNRVDTHPEYFLAEISPGTDVVKGTLNGLQKTAVGGIGFNAIDLKLALDLIAHESGETTCIESPDPTLPPTCTTVEKPLKTGVIAAHVGGASFKTDFTATTDVLKVSDIGLGSEAATVKFNGTQIFGFDLNKDSGRKFAFQAVHADRLTTVSVTPGVVARLEHDLNALKAQFEDLPAWALSGFAEIRLEGTAPAIEIEDGEPTESAPCDENGVCPEPVEGDPGHFMVKSGKLVFSAKDVTTVEISAPQCVVEAPREEEEQGEGEGDQPEKHPFTMLSSGVCK